MRQLSALAFVVLFVLLACTGCTAEDKRQWHEALRDWRGDNIQFGSHDRSPSE
jgi:hypothetical protein